MRQNGPFRFSIQEVRSAPVSIPVACPRELDLFASSLCGRPLEREKVLKSGGISLGHEGTSLFSPFGV